MSQIELVIFDLDGVIIDSKKNMKVSWEKVNKKLQLNKSFAEYFNLIGRPFNQILDKLGIKKKKEIIKLYNFYSKKNFNKIKLYPGVKKTLNFLKKNNIKYAIVTSKNYERTDLILKKFKLRNFIFISCPQKNLKGKPEPDQLNYVMKKTNISNKKVIYVGDMIVDYLSAKKAHVKFVFAKYGYGKMQNNYKYSINKFLSLNKFIQKNFRI